MEFSGGHFSERRRDAENRSVWGWLAAAAAAGVLMARGHGRASMMLGMAAVLWQERSRILQPEPANEGLKRQASGHEEAVTEGRAHFTPMDTDAEQGNWFLNMEPLPLVVHEETSTPGVTGQGGGLLDQEPGKTVQEEEWAAPFLGHEPWMNEGAAIPDSVELPEL